MHYVSQQAEDDLDNIWLYIARSSASMEVATRFVETISGRFLILADFPRIGRPREEDLGRDRRSYSVGEYIVIYSFSGEDVTILRVVHGRRDLENLISY